MASTALVLHPYNQMNMWRLQYTEVVVRYSLRIQIADLALRVIIPLGRLISIRAPEPVPMETLCDTSFTDHRYQEPLQYFGISQNLQYFTSALRIIEGDHLEHNPRALLALSRHIESLSVYGGTLTDNHWVFDEDSTTLTIWSMLSYYDHCL